MIRRTMIARPVGAWVALALALAGCGGEAEVKTEPVTGVVTLDDRPLEGALIHFEPAGGGKDGWVDSSGITDAEGRYLLKTAAGGSGAVAGPHRVSIVMAPKSDAIDAATEGAPAPKKRPKAAIPARYNATSELTFDVPAGGSNAANFAISSR